MKDFEPQAGSIIEFNDGERHRLAMVVDRVGKKKLVIWTADGDEMRCTEGDITYALGEGTPSDQASVQASLTKLDQAIDARRQEVDLAMLWEFVREEDEPMTPQALSELNFADDDDQQVLGVLRALRENPIYFKGRRDGQFEPRSDGQVASLKQQRQAQQQREQERRQIVDAIAATLKLPRPERQANIEAQMGDHDGLRNAIYLLQDFAAHGQDFRRRDEAVDLLDDIIAAIDVHLDGHMDQKAFFLMRQLELWEEHQSLALHRFRISPTVEESLQPLVRTLAKTPWEQESWRRDMTGWTTVTIDAEWSMDLDDALSCRPTIDGGWELAIHIADPSALVATGSPLDLAAQHRGTSIYLPTGTIPMFPEALSEGRMSLVAGQPRPAMTTRVIFNDHLDIVEEETFPSVIEVDRRLSYDEVDAMLQGDEGGRFASLVRHLAYVADEYRQRRTSEGGADFDLPDTQIHVDLNGDGPTVEVSVIEGDTPARALVSELMILNNTLIGRFLARHQIPAIFRVQPPPDFPLIDDEILAIPEGVARCFAQIRRMKPGDLSSRPERHFGLGVHEYAQATSPNRRYTDLVCQRQLGAYVTDRPLPYDNEAILEVLANAGGAIAQGYETQRESERYWLLRYLEGLRGEPLQAVVIDHFDDRGSRASVFLQDCAYRSKCSLRQKIPVGETVQVVVEQADARRDMLSLRQAPD